MEAAKANPKPSVQVEATLPGLTPDDDLAELRKAVGKAFAKTMGVNGDGAVVTPKTSGQRRRQLAAGDLSYDVLIAVENEQAATNAAGADVKAEALTANLQEQMAADPKLAGKKDKVKDIPVPTPVAKTKEEVSALLVTKQTALKKDEEEAVCLSHACRRCLQPALPPAHAFQFGSMPPTYRHCCRNAQITRFLQTKAVVQSEQEVAASETELQAAEADIKSADAKVADANSKAKLADKEIETASQLQEESKKAATGEWTPGWSVSLSCGLVPAAAWMVDKRARRPNRSESLCTRQNSAKSVD